MALILILFMLMFYMYVYTLHDNDIMEPVASTEQIEVLLSALYALSFAICFEAAGSWSMQHRKLYSYHTAP